MGLSLMYHTISDVFIRHTSIPAIPSAVKVANDPINHSECFSGSTGVSTKITIANPIHSDLKQTFINKVYSRRVLTTPVYLLARQKLLIYPLIVPFFYLIVDEYPQSNVADFQTLFEPYLQHEFFHCDVHSQHEI